MSVSVRVVNDCFWKLNASFLLSILLCMLLNLSHQRWFMPITLVNIILLQNLLIPENEDNQVARFICHLNEYATKVHTLAFLCPKIDVMQELYKARSHVDVHWLELEDEDGDPTLFMTAIERCSIVYTQGLTNQDMDTENYDFLNPLDDLIKAAYYAGESMPDPKRLHLHERIKEHFCIYNSRVNCKRVLSKKEERMEEIIDTKKDDGSKHQIVVVKMKVPTEELGENLEYVLTEYFGSQVTNVDEGKCSIEDVRSSLLGMLNCLANFRLKRSLLSKM